MSAWRKILHRDMSDVKKINFTRLNCKLQQLADDFMREGFTRNEVFLITEAIKDKTMLNEEVAIRMYRRENEIILREEGIY